MRERGKPPAVSPVGSNRVPHWVKEEKSEQVQGGIEGKSSPACVNGASHLQSALWATTKHTIHITAKEKCSIIGWIQGRAAEMPPLLCVSGALHLQ